MRARSIRNATVSPSGETDKPAMSESSTSSTGVTAPNATSVGNAAAIAAHVSCRNNLQHTLPALSQLQRNHPPTNAGVDWIIAKACSVAWIRHERWGLRVENIFTEQGDACAIQP